MSSAGEGRPRWSAVAVGNYLISVGGRGRRHGASSAAAESSRGSEERGGVITPRWGGCGVIVRGGTVGVSALGWTDEIR